MVQLPTKQKLCENPIGSVKLILNDIKIISQIMSNEHYSINNMPVVDVTFLGMQDFDFAQI